MSKIVSMQSVVPVTGISYCDLRPVIEADSIDEYREMLAEVGRLAGNDAFVQRMTKNRSGKEKICTDTGCLYFDKAAHTYEDEDGNIFQSGSVWAGQFEKPFDVQAIAPKVAEKRLTTPEQVIAGWDMKGEVSTMYGSTLHKAIECGIKYGEIPNNPHLAMLVQDYLDMSHEEEQASELFIADFEHHLCGVVDVLVNKGDRRVIVRDIKSGDIYKKITLTPRAKELWPDLPSKLISIYQLQLSFYAYILANRGYRVESLEIYAESAEAWQVVKLPVLDIREAL